MSPPLPRSLAPLDNESLPGYLLRLAHRLDLSPDRLAQITGLAEASHRPRGSYLLAIPPPIAATFGHATRLSPAEVAALTLDSLAPRYPPADARLAGRYRKVAGGLLVKESWIFARSTRYCPRCLAGDGSLIQRRHGGAWNKHWRLPLVFACLPHQRLLEHTCPGCGQQALTRSGGAPLLPAGATSGLHPAACRTPTPGPGPLLCAHRLDANAASDEDPCPAPLLVLQQHLLNLLHPGGPNSTTSISEPATPAEYVIDLRILTCLITASWPAADALVPNHHDAATIDAHVEHIRAQITADHRDLQLGKDNARYDTPPADAATAAALLSAATAITTADPGQARDLLAGFLRAAPATRSWLWQFRTGQGYCSPGLRRALDTQTGALRLNRLARAAADLAARRPPTPPQPVRFGVRHLPQRPIHSWITAYFNEFADIKPRLLEHVVAIRLAHTVLGGLAEDAATALGIPKLAAVNAITVVESLLDRTHRRTAFATALTNLTEYLDGRPCQIDYGHRRDALASWQITPQQWDTLIEGLPGQPVNGNHIPTTHWGNGKRALATVWIWTYLTHGDHIYAPAIRPDPTASRPGGEHVHYVNTRWRLIDTPIPGHYTRLRRRLDALAHELADQIDHQPAHRT